MESEISLVLSYLGEYLKRAPVIWTYSCSIYDQASVRISGASELLEARYSRLPVLELLQCKWKNEFPMHFSFLNEYHSDAPEIRTFSRSTSDQASVRISGASELLEARNSSFLVLYIFRNCSVNSSFLCSLVSSLILKARP